jgi:kynurenine formamidase
MMPFVELSHALETGMPVYPGDPEVCFATSVQDEPWHVLSLSLGSHSGTHVDAARHFVPGGPTIDEYPIERFVVAAVVVRVRTAEDEEIGWAALAQALADPPPGGAVLVDTGWDAHWGEETMLRHPYLGGEACERLVASGIGLVGTDALNVDSTVQGTKHAHEVLLGNDVLIVENLTNLSRLSPGQVFQCAFVPLKLAAGDGSPIRAYAWTV